VGQDLAMRQSRASYEVSARSTAPPKAVFAVLADAPGWPGWAGFLIHTSTWEREGTPAPGGVGAIRKMGRWPQFGREEILEYEPPTHMAYTVLSGIPARDYRADINLYPDTGGTLIRWRGTFTPTIPGTGALLAAVLRRIMSTFARRAAAEAQRRRGRTPGSP
jgi:uncharacterized protein YndB with AHSA1/START domain